MDKERPAGPTPTEHPGLAELTEKEREALRLVYRQQTSKEIARALGIAKATADQRIDTARAKLGGVPRRDAARLLVEHELGGPLPDRIAYDPIDIPLDCPWPQARPWPTDSRPTNQLSTRQRIAMIGGVALLGLVVMAVLLAIMVGIGAIVGR